MPSERPGRAGGTRDENRRRRLAELCEAAAALFLERGVHTVTVDQIVARAGLAKGSFYRYVRDKSELVETVIHPFATDVRRALETSESAVDAAGTTAELRAAYAALAADLLGAAMRYPMLARLCLKEARDSGDGAGRPIAELNADLVASGERLTRAAQEHGFLRSDWSPRVIALFVVGGSQNVLLAFLGGQELGAPPHEVAQTLVETVLQGVLGGSA